jgi:hypothetical protein
MSQSHGRPSRQRRFNRSVLAMIIGLLLIAGQAAVAQALGIPLVAAARAASLNSGKPNRFDPTSQAKSVNHAPAAPQVKTPPQPATTHPIERPVPVSMRPATITLGPTQSGDYVGSDGSLEIRVPSGSVTAADVTGAGGRMSLLVRQVLPPSGSSAGGSGHYSFGTYTVQVLDASGRLAAQGLRKPIPLSLHFGNRSNALDVQHAYAVVNGSLPPSVNLDPSAALPVAAPAAPRGTTPASSARTAATPSPTTAPAVPPGGRPAPQLGALSRQSATLDAQNQTLTSNVTMASASTSVGFGTNSPVATFGKPDPFNVDLNGGALTASYPIDVPEGPGGLKPPLSLVYNSAGVSEQHSAQGAAPWTGEGWTLSLGAISWAEHNVETVCQTCTPIWEDSWQLNDAFGTGSDLIPPNINVSTYMDDTGNGITPSPVAWHTATETRARVYSFTSPNPPAGMTAPPPCFRVFLANGIMEEFGCTADSLQYYSEPTGSNAGKDYIANWLLDLITDARGNQIHVTYQRDVATGASSVQYPRDAVMATVEWDSPGCRNAQAACTGSAWAPLMRVNFAASHSVTHVAGATCGVNGNLRCDDPVDLSGSGGAAAPTVQSTFVLDDARCRCGRPGARSGTRCATTSWATTSRARARSPTR